jgi:hypothetical protein
MPQTLLFDFPAQIITVPLPDTTLDLQFLINSIRDAEDDLTPGMSYAKIADAFGKQDLGGGVKVGITVVLLNGWRVMFAARPGPETVSVSITGGNFVGEAGANPVAPSLYTQVTTTQSSSATIITPESDTNLVYLVESLRNSHPAFGNVFYWDPYGGNDTNSGLTPSTAVKTFAAGHALASSGNGDVIFCRSTDPGGTTTVNETLVITKHNLKLRGPGDNVKIIPSSTSAPTIGISADNVEVSGFYLETAATGSQNAMTISGNNILIRDLWIGNSRGHGIAVSSSARFRLLTTLIDNCQGDGLHFANNTSQALVSKCLINNSVIGIALFGTGLTSNVIENCLIYQNSTYGVDIGTGVENTALRSGNTITGNISGNTRNQGTGTYIETPAGGASETDIASAVWEEVMLSHNVAGSAGKMLQVIRNKAGLAAIKR